MTVPQGWIERRLGDICSIEIGGTPARSIAEYWDIAQDTDNAWVSIRDMRQHVITVTAEKITDAGIKHSNVKLQQPGTVLLSFKLTIGRVAVAGIPLYTNEAIAALKPTHLLPSYLYHGLQHWNLLKGVDQAIKGATLNKEKLKHIVLEYPEAETEQSIIAEVLSAVDRAIEQIEALIAKQQRIKTGLMQDLLTRGIDEHGNLRSEETHELKDSVLGRIPVEWNVATLGDLIGPIVSGWSPICDSDPAGEGEWGILKTTAVVWSGYDMMESKRLPAGLFGIESIEVQPDDILITRKGPVDRVGVVVHVRQTRSRLMIPDTVFRTRLVNGSNALPEFLPLALGSEVVQSDWFQKKIGLADAQVNLNHSILRSTLLPMPDLREQQHIVSLAAAISKRGLAELDAFVKLRRLKAGLMQDLLTGRKRVTPLLELMTTD